MFFWSFSALDISSLDLHRVKLFLTFILQGCLVTMVLKVIFTNNRYIFFYKCGKDFFCPLNNVSFKHVKKTASCVLFSQHSSTINFPFFFFFLRCQYFKTMLIFTKKPFTVKITRCFTSCKSKKYLQGGLKKNAQKIQNYLQTKFPEWFSYKTIDPIGF